jgi:hypothetical protein
MIKGKKKEARLTSEEILSMVSPYDIYRYYQGPFKLNTVCINKCRGEKDPSLIIGNKLTRELTHKDFGDYNWRGNCFNFVQQIYKCDFPTALRIISKDFGLVDSSISVKSVITWEKPNVELKPPPLFHIIYYSKMSKRGLDYWGKLEQGEDDLKRENIFQPKEIWRNRRRLPLGDLLTFVYYYQSIDKWKIYRPFAPKKIENTYLNHWKWDSNVPFDYIDNISSINKDCSKVFLSKSKKDRMVLMKALQTNCIGDVQAEDPACLSEETLNIFKSVDNRYCVMDNDKKGKEFSWWLTKEHQFKHINVPDKYLTVQPKCTDFADLCYNFGVKGVTNHFKQKNII